MKTKPLFLIVLIAINVIALKLISCQSAEQPPSDEVMKEKSDTLPKALTPIQITQVKNVLEQTQNLSIEEKVVIVNKLISNITKSSQGQKAFAPPVGAPIVAQLADQMTLEYYNDFPQVALPYMPKSIYLDSAQILTLIKTQRKKCDNGNKNFGLRIYFAQYPLAYPDSRLAGMNTIILRAVCDGMDVGHDPNENINQNYVAYNYGDVCPPYCDKDRAKICTGGTYRSGGDCLKTCQ